MLSDEYLDYWADCYTRLNTKHRLADEHGYSFERFIANPRLAELWINVYFANQALMQRSGGGRILLRTFLDNEPALLLAVILAADAHRRLRVCGRPGNEPLPIGTVSDAIQERFHRFYERTAVIEHRGDCYFEPFRNHDNSKKWKTQGVLC